MRIVIITAHHKNDDAISIFKKYFSPVQVGASISDVDLGIEKDNEGENISLKNKTFCELTAHYNLWKKDGYDYAGLMHYRRIFSPNKSIFNDIIKYAKYSVRYSLNLISMRDLNLHCDTSIFVKSKCKLDNESKSLLSYIESEDFKNIDVLVPRKVRYAFVNVRDQYSLRHCKHQFDLFNKIIIEKHPSMKPSINVVNGQKKMYAYNMFMMKRELYREYNEIIFDVLFALEEVIKLDGMDSHQQRIFGFLSERFLNYFLEWKKGTLRIKELQVVFVADELK
jgi:hypothetical protein